MLVLTRKPGETISVNVGLEITLLEIAGGRARIGLTAPESVVILRGELADGDLPFCHVPFSEKGKSEKETCAAGQGGPAKTPSPADRGGNGEAVQFAALNAFDTAGLRMRLESHAADMRQYERDQRDVLSAELLADAAATIRRLHGLPPLTQESVVRSQ